MFRIVNTLCLPGVGDSAVDRVCFSSTHSCNTQVCATGSQREAKQLLHWGKLEVIFSPNEDGFLLNLKPWHEVLWAWSKFTSRSNSFANCFGDLNNGRQRVVGGREVTESCVGESSLGQETALADTGLNTKLLHRWWRTGRSWQVQHKTSRVKKSG